MTRYDPATWEDMTGTQLSEHWDDRINKGLSFYDWINADAFIAQVIVDVCQRFIDHGRGHPPSLTGEEWDGILIDMRDGFQEYVDHHISENMNIIDSEGTKYGKAMALFAKWHVCLWD